MALRCTVCDHPKIVEINTSLADGSGTVRDIAGRYGFSKSSVDRHAQNHVPKALVRAVHRKGATADEVFAERITFLWDECSNGVKEAQRAVRVVANEEGELVPVGRDLSALAPLLGQAHANLRLYADRHQLTSQAQATTTLNVLCVSIPGPPAPQASSPNVIEATSEVVAPDDTEE